jgi:hypothetical protein
MESNEQTTEVQEAQGSYLNDNFKILFACVIVYEFQVFYQFQVFCPTKYLSKTQNEE